MPDDLAAALAALRGCRAQLLSARVDAADAARHLAGARQSRATELVEKLSAALTHADRLIVVCTGDLRAQRAGQ